MTQIIIEGIILGLILIVVGYIVRYLAHLVVPRDLPATCDDWNKYHIFEITLFFTGFITHVTLKTFRLVDWCYTN